MEAKTNILIYTFIFSNKCCNFICQFIWPPYAVTFSWWWRVCVCVCVLGGGCVPQRSG